MKILFLSQVLPYPLDAGPKARSFFVLKHLANAGHKVTLVTFVREKDGTVDDAPLREICESIHKVPLARSRLRDLWYLSRSLATQSPFLIIRDQVPAMFQKVRQVLKEEGGFHAVHADQLWMASYAQIAGLKSENGRPAAKILDQHNAVFQVPKRMIEAERNPLRRFLLNREERKLFSYEESVCRRFDRVVWVTEQDRACFQNLPPNQQAIIPISVDPALKPPLKVKRDAFRITFIGGLHWPPNHQGVRWFVDQVWPSIQKQSPGTVFSVIGKTPADFGECSHAQVEYFGHLKDPTPVLEETRLFVVPLQAGGGMRVKILDAWCWGIPVVSTPIGAEGLAVRDGVNALLARTPGEFSSASQRVLQDRALASGLSREGHLTVQRQYDWKENYKAWDEIYKCAYYS